MVLRPLFVFAASLCLIASASAASATDGHERDGTPAGYNGFMVFMATGALPQNASYFLDGAIFQEKIMKRKPAEIARNRAEALRYFETRFGIFNADSNPDIVFIGFYVDPRIKYRAYVISGRRVPPEGFEVHDGGWIALVINPNGIALGGDFAGRTVPVNTVFSFGDYNIELPRQGRGPKPPPIVVHYRCNNPLVTTFSGGEVFDCDLSSDEFGDGLGEGMNKPVINNGMLEPNGRTVLTFSDRGGF